MKKGRIIINFILIFALLVSFLPVLSGCAKEAESDFLIAYTNSSNDDVVYYPYPMQDAENLSFDEILNDVITKLLIEGPEDGIHYCPLPADVKLKSYDIEDGVLTLDFDSAYASLSNVQELILKACVVLTLAQMEEVESILFTMDGEPVTDSKGNPVGAMNPDRYVDILLSDEELLKQETSVRIYFANEDGTALSSHDYQFALDNQTLSLEEYIIRKLIEGPDEDGGYPTMDPQVSLINIMTTDNICYVNFSANFLEQNQGVSDEIMIYSIVNSLTGLAYINSVQFLVEGESVSMLHKTFDISKPLTRRFDLISTN